MIDKLIEKIIELNNPSIVGFDTRFDYLPERIQAHCRNFEDISNVITEFNCEIIDKIYKIIPAIKIQIAYYEMYGHHGLKAMLNTIKYAKQKNLLVIVDAKRCEMGSTATAYSTAYLGETAFNDFTMSAFPADFLTVNGYMGIDGVKPFIDACKTYDKGIFIMIKTNNPSSSQIEDKIFMNGNALYEEMAILASDWGKDQIGKYGYSNVGGFVGASSKSQAEKLRADNKSLFFFVPKYGATGASISDLTSNFDANGLGAVINASRQILCAYKNPKYSGENYEEAAYNATMDMKKEINSVLQIKNPLLSTI